MTILASRKIADAFDSAMMQITVASAVLMIGILIALVMFIVKYHHKRHPKPARIHGSMKLEILWTVIPTLISVWMFFVGYEGFMILRTMPEDSEAHVVYVTGRQWAWEFEHKDSGVTDSVLVVPKGKPVKCYLTAPADDVLHSFFIPHYSVKEDCVPGKITNLWFEGDEVGKYRIFCTEFCGNDHALMYTWLDVREPDDFRDYIREKMEQRYAPVTDPADVLVADSEAMKKNVKDVRGLYLTYCKSCHGEGGQGGLIEGARSFVDAPVAQWKQGVKIHNIFGTLTNGVPGTKMNAFDALSSWEKFALAHYVANFYKDGPDRSKSTAADITQLIEKYKLNEQRPVILDFPIDEVIDEMAKK